MRENEEPVSQRVPLFPGANQPAGADPIAMIWGYLQLKKYFFTVRTGDTSQEQNLARGQWENVSFVSFFFFRFFLWALSGGWGKILTLDLVCCYFWNIE